MEQTGKSVRKPRNLFAHLGAILGGAFATLQRGGRVHIRKNEMKGAKRICHAHQNRVKGSLIHDNIEGTIRELELADVHLLP